MEQNREFRNLSICRQVIFDKDAWEYTRGQGQFLQQIVGKLYPYEKNKMGPLSYTTYKNQPQISKYLRLEAAKLQEENR